MAREPAIIAYKKRKQLTKHKKKMARTASAGAQRSKRDEERRDRHERGEYTEDDEVVDDEQREYLDRSWSAGVSWGVPASTWKDFSSVSRNGRVSVSRNGRPIAPPTWIFWRIVTFVFATTFSQLFQIVLETPSFFFIKWGEFRRQSISKFPYPSSVTMSNSA